MIDKINDFVSRHPEIILLCCAAYMWQAYDCLKDYRKAIEMVVTEAEEIVKNV